MRLFLVSACALVLPLGSCRPTLAEDHVPVVVVESEAPQASTLQQPGMVLPVAPSAAPGGVPPEPGDPLDLGRERYNEGDLAGTVVALTPWLESRRGPRGRSRTAGHLLLGMAHMGLENWNLASAHFYQVRRDGGPLAPYGAFNEALVDHKRGRHRVAAQECASYRKRWPEGPHADECLLLMGDAYSAEGNRGAGISAYREYLELHPDTPRKEEIELATALAWARTSPEQGIARLHELALDHSYPSTDLAVQAELLVLAEAGHPNTKLPNDPRSLMRRCASLRRSGRFEEAWELFQHLAGMASTDDEIARWVEDNEDRYAWGTRNYEVYATAAEKQYAEKPDPELAWDIFRAWGRAGEWKKAAETARTAEKAHGSGGRWRSAGTEVAWAVMLAGDYKDAASRFADLAKRGGGNKARFYSAFSSMRAGDLETAKQGFDELCERGGGFRAAAHYWRAKVHEGLGDADAAAKDQALVRQLDDDGWYGMLLAQAEQPALAGQGEDPGWKLRDGRWHGPPEVELATWTRPQSRLLSLTGLVPSQPPDVLLHPWEAAAVEQGERPKGVDPRGWAALRWDRVQAQQPAASTPEAPATIGEVPQAGLAIPDGYLACRWYDRDSAARDFYRFAEANKEIWEDLPAAHDLANAGLYTEATRVVFDVFEEWRDVVQTGAKGDPRRKRILDLKLTTLGWRPYLLFVRDHYHAARSCHGLDKAAVDEEERIAALRLAYPLVRPEVVWAWSRHFDVDPYLVYGIMRQESTYRNTALSPVGAIGLIQVMPSTGARIAALLGEHRYSPGQLEDPEVNLRFGIFYLSRLLDRFDGVYPLAVASYNGGPHNMSRWYKPWHGVGGEGEGQLDLDVLVEQIQYDETRDYVKRVSGHYARYVEIYEGGDARLIIPPRPKGDDPTVIDF